ncbi:MAG: multinuclear nonheme iron-dependent oxidase [Leptospirales bacterium]
MTRPFKREVTPSSILAIPKMGIGLSTDLYFPPIEDLLTALSPGFTVDYLEIFRGRTEDLRRARTKIVPDSIGLTYHGDTLWYTQSDFPENPAYIQEIRRVKHHLDALGSPWMIHECAHKTILGRTFGSYLPPVMEESCAQWIRTNAQTLQSALDGRALLVEIPPFPMFSLGALSAGTFFGLLLEGTDLGMGLDIGHAMTAYRLEHNSVTPERFAHWIRTTFPTHHIVQIHLGGLVPFQSGSGTHFWDDHSHPIPDLLWEALEAVLSICPLPALKGVALEVDNKEISLIVREFSRFRSLVSRLWKQPCSQEPRPTPVGKEKIDLPSPFLREDCRSRQENLYDDFLSTLLTRDFTPTLPLKGEPALFRNRYLASEIWRFGGYIPDLFPDTLALLEGIPDDLQQSFVSFFHTIPITELEPYDFLRTKVFLIRLWIQNLSDRKLLQGEVAQRVHEMARMEGDRILMDQEWINGDPCPSSQ